MFDTNELVLNMGPQHPSTHGVLRVVLRLDGEKVVDADVVIGYLHRGIEKLSENRNWTQIILLTDRMDYVAAATSNVSRRCRGRSAPSNATRCPQPSSGSPDSQATAGQQRVPTRSTWAIGSSDNRPCRRAVSSPSRSATHTCAQPWTVIEKSNTLNAMNSWARSMPGKGPLRLCPPRKKRKDSIRRLRTNCRRQVLARSPANAREAPKSGEQDAAAAHPNAGNGIELRMQVAPRPSMPMKGDSEPMRLVADALQQ